MEREGGDRVREKSSGEREKWKRVEWEGRKENGDRRGERRRGKERSGVEGKERIEGKGKGEVGDNETH